MITLTLAAMLATSAAVAPPAPAADVPPVDLAIVSVAHARRLHGPPLAAIVWVRHIDPAQAAGVVEVAYRDMPGVTVKAIPPLRCVAVWAGAPTSRDITDLIERLDVAAESRVGGFRQAPVCLDDTSVLVVLAQWLKKEHTGETIRGATSVLSTPARK